MFKNYSRFMFDGEEWIANKDKTLLACIMRPPIFRAWGVGNMASMVSFDDILLLRNVYVLPEARGKGVFREFMDDLFNEVARKQKAMLVFPTAFEIDGDPINDPKSADIIVDYDQEKKDELRDWYLEFDFKPVKSAYYSIRKPIIGDLVNTMISGEQEPRKARKDEFFAPISIKQNFNGQFLGINFSVYIPQALFYEEEILDEFKERA